jgi:transposase InsO family protein
LEPPANPVRFASSICWSESGYAGKVYRSRDDARQDVFADIEMFYSPKRKHVRNGMPSPVEFEKRQKT